MVVRGFEIMTGIDLKDELADAVAKLEPRHTRAIRDAYGIPNSAWDHVPYTFGVVRVGTFSGRLYEPAEDGIEMFVMATNLLAADEIEDLIAVRLSAPDLYFLRLGMSKFLGGFEISRRLICPLPGIVPPTSRADDGPTHDPLQIYLDPLAFLRAGATGAVALDGDAVNELLRLGCPVQVMPQLLMAKT